MRRVTLLTDFGTADGYVGAVKGVLVAGAPDAVLDDAGHELPRGDVAHAAWTLARYWWRYPEGTIHLVVVDPGVGTARRAMALEADGRLGVGPDNGVFDRVLDEAGRWRAVTLPVPEGAAATFHGRDVFAPAAARLAAGAPLEALGPELARPERLAIEPAPGSDGRVRAVDRFGNLVTDVPGARLAPHLAVEIAGRLVAPAATYADVGPGEPLALVGSDGTVEVAVRDGSAARVLGVGVGAALRIVPPPTVRPS